MSLNKVSKSHDEGEWSSNNTNQEEASSAARSRLLRILLIFCLVATCIYLLDAEEADSEVAKLVVHKPDNVTTSSLRASPVVVAPADDDFETPISEGQDTPPSSSSSGSGGDFDTSCSDVCTKREANRKHKFGGDLLEFQDLVRLAEAAHDKVQSTIREGYGEYFEQIFIVNGTTNGQEDGGGTHYRGMKPPGSPSRERMKRKLKIKVLKMMSSVKATESNVHGCDCVGKTGSMDDSGIDEDVLTAIPEFYEKYVFANGGHSNAAGHGNMFSEAYTAVFGNDVRPIWEAIGIEMIDRNYAMGAMAATPAMSTCTKEVFGTDVDFLAWNYGMTDGKIFSAAHYIYRGALIPSRPALVTIDAVIGERLTKSFEEVGLAMFDSKVDKPVIQEFPDMTPDEIPISDEEAKKLPPMVRDLKCNGRMEGKEHCFRNKWSCSEAMLEAGVDCICPHVGKRSSWHMGYRMHVLHGHLIGLPFIEMLLEGLKELENTGTVDSDQLLADLQKEEDAEFQQFMESPLVADILADNYDVLGKPTDPLYETWFRGQSICRTAFLPSQSRFLGLMTESDKTGDIAIYTHETYDTGDFFYSNRRGDDGNFTYVGDDRPPAGKFSLMASTRERAGFTNITSWEEECPAVVMPDYKDSFYAPLLDRKASITFPNKKEKEHYGYDPKLFKGVIAIILAPSSKCKKCDHAFDLVVDDFLEGSATMAVNSKPVKSIRRVSNGAMILEGDNQNPFWEPNRQTEDYTIEFQVGPNAALYHLRVANIILM